MRRAGEVDVLLALLGTDRSNRLSGDQLVARLTDAGCRARPAPLLGKLLGLETTGHVVVERSPSYSFGLTPLGQDVAYGAGPGTPVDVVLVMADLVGFTAYTERCGDSSAHQASELLATVAEVELAGAGGRLVKPLGDGFLGALPSAAPAVDVLRRIRKRLVQPDGTEWAVHAGVRHGRPIQHRGDLFGSDVNLVARLCQAAGPDEVIVSGAPGTGERQSLAVRGIDPAVPVYREALA
jgi:class 3 adenylate cyclase